MKTLALTPKLAGRSHHAARTYAGDYIDRPYDLPDAEVPSEEPDEPSEPDDFADDEDDDRWDVFVADDDEFDLEPDPRDFDNGTNDAWDTDE
jgi:hypothetical protein